MPFDVQGATAAGYSPSQIADEVGKAHGFDTAGARAAGYSDNDIINELNNKSAVSDSFVDDFKQAGGSLMTEAGALAEGLGNTIGSDTVKNAGSWLKANAPTPSPGYQNRGGQFTQHLLNGDFSTAAGDLAHGAVATAGNTAGVLGGFALGGPVGAAAVAGLESEGAHANEAANGGEVTGKHLLQAAPEAATDAAITGVTGRFMPTGGGVVNALKRSALMGVSGAGQSAADQAIEKGSVDPSQVLNAGASGAASAGLAEAPGLASQAASRGTLNLQARGYQPPDEITAYTWKRVGDDMAAAKADAASAGKPVTDFQAANNLKATYKTDLINLINGLRERGADKEDVNTLRSLVLDQALRHNNTIDFATNGLFSRIDDMDLPDMGGVTKEDIKNKLLDLNTVSGQSFLKNGVGFWQSLGGKVGQVAGIAGGLVHNPMDVLLSMGGKHSVGAGVGSMLGAGLDRLTGGNMPSAVLQRIAAQRYLDRLGLEQPGPVNVRIGQPQTGPDPVTGNAPDPVPVNTPTRAGPPGPQQPPSGPSLPPLRVNTPQDVQEAIRQDDGLSTAGPAQALQASLTAAAMGMPAAHPSSSTWERFVQGGVGALLTRGQVRQAAAQVFSPEVVQSLDAMKSVPNAAQVLSPVIRKLQADQQARAQGIDPNATKGASGDVDAQGRPIRSRAAYDNAVKAYHTQVGQLAVQAMLDPGLQGVSPQAATAVSAAIRNVGNEAGRTNKMMRAMAEIGKLPPNVAAIARPYLFHQALLDHGPE